MTDLSQATPANTNPMPTPNSSVGPEGEPGIPNPAHDVVGEQGPDTVPGEPGPQGEPAVQEPKPDTKLPEPPEKAVEPTGNEFVDNLIGELQKNEVDIDKLFGDYLETGNEESIDLAYLEEKVGKLAAQGLIAGVKAENTKLETESAKQAELIYNAVGGEDMWKSIIDWIGSGESGLTREGAVEYNKMLDAGGVQAELAAQELVKMFKQSPGFTQDAQLQQGDQVAQPAQLEPISRIEYVEELDKVVRQYGEYSPQAEALHKRREYTLSKGA